MSLALLGEGFDLHGGGQDLIFPHHENERAQAVALGKGFARHWMHHGMVEASGGEKMSKSLGNVLLLSTLFEQGLDPRAYRLLVLRSHYRAPMVVTAETLDDAAVALQRVDALSRRLAEAGAPDAGGEETDASVQAGVEVRRAFAERMNDDLDTPGATAVLFDAIRRANSALDAREDALGVELARAALDCFAAVGLEAAGARPFRSRYSSSGGDATRLERSGISRLPTRFVPRSSPSATSSRTRPGARESVAESSGETLCYVVPESNRDRVARRGLPTRWTVTRFPGHHRVSAAPGCAVSAPGPSFICNLRQRGTPPWRPEL